MEYHDGNYFSSNFWMHFAVFYFPVLLPKSQKLIISDLSNFTYCLSMKSFFFFTSYVLKCHINMSCRDISVSVHCDRQKLGSLKS